VKPTSLRSFAQLRIAALGYGQIPVAMPLPLRSLLAPFAKALQCVLAQDLEELVADLAPMLLHYHERLVNELDEYSEAIRARHAVPTTDGLGGLQRPRASKDGESSEEHLLGPGQQGVAPVDVGS